MSTDPSFKIDEELLNDFFTEADEHLLTIRQALLHFEAAPDSAHTDAGILDELLGSFHSFKGISAIVGLASAEAVAHATEGHLRLIRDKKMLLSRERLELLMRVAQKLEHIVAAFRAKQPLPDYESLLADLRKHSEKSGLSPVDPSPVSTSPAQAGNAKVEDGSTLWICSFSPSQELSARGVNIDKVRNQLGIFGKILKSTPVVTGQNAITFEFEVAAKEDPGRIAALEAMGVRFRQKEPEKSKPVAPSQVEEAMAVETAYNPFIAPSHVVRVDLKHLDDLMRITGELVIQRSRLDVQLEQVKSRTGRDNLHNVREVTGAFGRSLRDLREAIMRIRLVPVAEVFNRMPFVVRDLARGTEKKVRLELGGQDTAVDKYLIERLKDPLLHLVRNAFSHGVETAEERKARGKPEEAVIELRAATAGESVIIHVRDDGKGIDPNAIVQKARKLGLEVPDTVDNAAILNILCSPGFSTRDDADRAAGRGVGMAVVQSTLRELGGSLTLESEVGRGTQFTLRLPLTLTIAQTLVVSAAGQTCAIPQSFVQEILHVSEKQVELANGVEVISYRSGVLPVVRLSGMFRLKTAAKPILCLLVITSERGCVGLLAERIVGLKEVVVRALRDPLIQVEGVIGATELGDGKPVLILDGNKLTSGSVMPLQNHDLPKEKVPA